MLSYNVNHYNNKQICNKDAQKSIQTKHISTNERQEYKNLQQHNNGMYKYRATSYVKKHKKTYRQTQLAKVQDKPKMQYSSKEILVTKGQIYDT